MAGDVINPQQQSPDFIGLFIQGADKDDRRMGGSGSVSAVYKPTVHPAYEYQQDDIRLFR
jgi:hypothetical protein